MPCPIRGSAEQTPFHRAHHPQRHHKTDGFQRGSRPPPRVKDAQTPRSHRFRELCQSLCLFSIKLICTAMTGCTRAVEATRDMQDLWHRQPSTGWMGFDAHAKGKSRRPCQKPLMVWVLWSSSPEMPFVPYLLLASVLHKPGRKLPPACFLLMCHPNPPHHQETQNAVFHVFIRE